MRKKPIDLSWMDPAERRRAMGHLKHAEECIKVLTDLGCEYLRNCTDERRQRKETETITKGGQARSALPARLFAATVRGQRAMPRTGNIGRPIPTA